MTREEYIDFANALKNNYTIDFDKLPEFCDMAITALSAIEKIRAEIEESHYITQDPIYAKGLETALEIIDKHVGGNK